MMGYPPSPATRCAPPRAAIGAQTASSVGLKSRRLPEAPPRPPLFVWAYLRLFVARVAPSSDCRNRAPPPTTDPGKHLGRHQHLQ
jgi:hypothetical protein